MTHRYQVTITGLPAELGGDTVIDYTTDDELLPNDVEDRIRAMVIGTANANGHDPGAFTVTAASADAPVI
jgi:hypothetical protein